MKFWKWILNDRHWDILWWGGFAVLFMSYTLARGIAFVHNSLHPIFPACALVLLYCVGLALRQEWARWVGVTCVVCGFAFMLLYNYFGERTLWSMGTLTMFPFLLAHVWLMPITRVQELIADPEFMQNVSARASELTQKLANRPEWKVVVFLRRPPTLDAARLAEFAARAFGSSFEIRCQKVDSLEAAFLPSVCSGPTVAGASPIWVCYSPPNLLGIFLMPPIVPDWSRDGLQISGPEREAIEAHQAVVEIVSLPQFGDPSSPENGYAVTGKLAAEFLRDDGVGVCFPREERVFPKRDALEQMLRCEYPAQALEL